MDLFVTEGHTLEPHKIYVCPTRIGCKFPKGHYGQIASRSGQATKGVVVQGGVIDADYQGELKVIVANIGPDTVTIKLRVVDC